MNAVVIAAMQSSAGKTTVAVGVMAALRRRGLDVQPYKVGPDYIDPSYHEAACGRSSRNLDRWMLDLPTMRALYARSSARADVSVVEGVMGLFDGRTGEGERASTAEVARAIGAPIVLVLDVAKMGRTAAAMLMGVHAFEPRLRLAGVILNRVASDSHLEAMRTSIAQTGVPILGVLRRDSALTVPERYLGLVPQPESTEARCFIDRAAAAVEANVDLDALLRLSHSDPIGTVVTNLFPNEPIETCVRIAVARDRAFHFYYEDGLDLLRAWGADLVPFSPLKDRTLPAGTQGVYIGGGFPELFAGELSSNGPMLNALREAARRGLPVYGECGGYMYLGETLTDREGAMHRMVGLTPLVSSMASPRLSLGYRTVQALRDTLLLRCSESAPGHEFHWSTPAGDDGGERAAYCVDVTSNRREGYAQGRVLGSYVHLHFGCDARLAPRFVAACAKAQPAESPKRERKRLDGRITPKSDASGSEHLSEEHAHGPGREDAPSHPGTLLRLHGRPGPVIEATSLRIADAALGESTWTEQERVVARRLVYAVGDPSIASSIRMHPRAIVSGVAALRAGCTIFCDVKMVQSGVNQALARGFGCVVTTGIDDPDVVARARRSGYPRAAEALLHFGTALDGAIVAIGNAPTALLALLDLFDAGVARPAFVAGIPVGFVAAAESKEALIARDIPHVTVLGSRGGTPLAVATINALLLLAAQT